jgi:hypothetical protein
MYRKGDIQIDKEILRKENFNNLEVDDDQHMMIAGGRHHLVAFQREPSET